MSVDNSPVLAQEEATLKSSMHNEVEVLKLKYTEELKALKLKLERETENSKLELLEEKEEKIKGIKVQTITMTTSLL